MDYIEVEFKVDPVQLGREILYADLNEAGYEAIEDTPQGLKAYIPKNEFSSEALEDFMIFGIENVSCSFEITNVESQNWNALWESNFEAIEINEKCRIRAPFHVSMDIPYEIIIAPQMSFGTGHHETTFLLAETLFEIDLKEKSVLDMGCGTGVLAFLAEKLEAYPILGIDIEDWAYANALENKELNSSEVDFLQGGVEQIGGRTFDIILANINKNVLLRDIEQYVLALKNEGLIFFSGFYNTDIDDLVEKGERLGLSFVRRKIKNNWAMLLMKK